MSSQVILNNVLLISHGRYYNIPERAIPMFISLANSLGLCEEMCEIDTEISVNRDDAEDN